MPSPSDIKSNVITSDHVRTIVNRAFGDRTEIVDYQILPYSNYAIGFLGSHKNLEVTVQRVNATDREKRNFFAKAVPQESVRQTTFIRQRRVFNQEADFYNEMMPLLLDSYEGEPWAPKCYLANEDFVVLEDIRGKGYRMCENKILTADHLRSAARALARMHACSVLAEKKLGKSLKDVCPKACVEQIFNQNTKDRGLFDLMIELIEKIAREHGRDPAMIAAAFEKAYNKIGNPREINQVISHTDTWPNNFMFNLDDPSKCVILDFQLVRYGNRMWDVAQLIYFSTTREIRDKGDVQHYVVKAYHEEFNEVIRRHDDGLQLPSLSDTLDEYEDARLLGFFSALFYFPFLLVGSEEYLRLKDNPEDSYNMYILRLNNDSVLKYMKKNKEYARRITETALELTDYCKKLFPKKSNGA
ncbi:uncharacterized protein LOC103316398 [Nasonia vitripennis]|uniref:CHK kinase-like domain-containing protein n=1 Tax=Nasonia vitripennis TaxID=7425 RepID=A0A7M7LR28_NASVI|nr:uncharacterized protein LOC103316398 [Nasonia vitripennis]